MSRHLGGQSLRLVFSSLLGRFWKIYNVVVRNRRALVMTETARILKRRAPRYP